MKKRFFSPIFILALIVFLFFFLVGLVKNGLRHYTLNQETQNLEQEIRELDEKNRGLLGTLQFLKGDFFLEEEARTKFGLKKTGETLVIVPKAEDEEEKALREFSGKTESNAKRWWQYFFGP